MRLQLPRPIAEAVRKGPQLVAATTLLSLVAACSPTAKAEPAGVIPATRAVQVVKEAFQLPLDTAANLDSPAVWHGPGGQNWLLSTAKEADAVVIHDAATGEPVGRVGEHGSRTGQLARPNGIAVLGDVVLVVERDNHRVQGFRLPDLAPIGHFGSDDLVRPYGIAWHPGGSGGFEVYITDAYETAEEEIPSDSELGERVRHFTVRTDGTTLRGELQRSFGDTSGEGVLRKVESIAADSAHKRLLIAEELEGDSYYKVYDLEGRFTGRSVGRGVITQEAEGIVLYACEDGSGYWVATDQGEPVNTFHVFDRISLEHAGSFSGPRTHTTDGVALTQHAFGGFPAGAFYASHADGSMSAFSWTGIASALGLRSDCTRGG